MRSPRLWLVPVCLLLVAATCWVLGVGDFAWRDEGIRESEEPAALLVSHSADGTAAKQVELPSGPEAARTSLAARRILTDGRAFGIEGKVVDVLDKGMPGVSVSACDLNELFTNGPKAARLLTVKSDDDGDFRLEGVRGTRLFLLAETEEGDFGTLFVNRSPVAGRIRDMRVLLHAGMIVRGRVVDEQGQPIESALILPTPMLDWTQRFWMLREQQSDGEGRFELAGLPPGGLRLSVWAAGYRLRLLSVEKDKVDQTVEIRLVSAAEITLPCRIEAKKEALAELLALDPKVDIRKLEHDGHRWLLPSPFRGLRFGRDGTCEFRGFLPGKLTAFFSTKGKRLEPFRLHRELKEGKQAQEMLWRPSFRLPLEARLLDEEAQPLVGIKLSYHRAPNRTSLRSDAEGNIRIDEFAAQGERAYLEVLSPGWYFATERSVSTSTYLTAGLGQELELRKGPSLGGQVLKADGQPAPGAKVVLLPDEADTRKVLGVSDTDAEGRFHMTPQWPKQPMQVRVAASLGSDLAIHPRGLTLRQSSRIEGLTLRLQAGARIEGRLVRANGRPATGQPLILRAVLASWLPLWDGRAGRTGLARCDSKGSFAFEGMPTGSWQLELPQGDVYLDGEPIAFDLKIGTVRDLGTVIVREGQDIAGRFLDLDGKAHEQKNVLSVFQTINPASTQRKSISRSTTLTDDGGFRVKGLPPGHYHLMFAFHWNDNRAPRPPAGGFNGLNRLGPYRSFAEAGQTDLELRVPKPGFGDLDLLILPDTDAWLPSELHLSLHSLQGSWWGHGEQRMPVRAGVVHVRGIRAGRYRLRVRHPRFGRLDQEVLIQNGQTSKARVDLRKLSERIDVRVQDERGKPIAAAWVGLLPLIDNNIEHDDPWGIYWPPSRKLWGELESDAKGKASLLPTRATRSLVMVWKPGFIPFARPVMATAGPIVVTLRKGTELRMRISKRSLGATNKEAPWGLQLRCLESTTKDRDPRLDKGVTFVLYGNRRYRTTSLPPGRYELWGGRGSSGQAKRNVVGKSVYRVFRLEAGTPLELDL